jgi:hypothetical protein
VLYVGQGIIQTVALRSLSFYEFTSTYHELIICILYKTHISTGDKNSSRYCSVHKFSSISTAEMILVSSSSGVQNDYALSKLIRPLGHSMSSQQMDVALVSLNR